MCLKFGVLQKDKTSLKFLLLNILEINFFYILIFQVRIIVGSSSSSHDELCSYREETV